MDINQHIRSIKQYLEELHLEFNNSKNNSLKLDLKTQLNAVVKSIVQIEKAGSSIPVSLREVKLELSNKLSLLEDIEKQQNELLDVLVDFINKNSIKKNLIKTTKRPRKTTGKQIELIDIINANLLKAGSILYKKYKGEVLKATITDEGNLQITINNIEKVYTSVSSAAVAFTMSSVNGWDFWKVEGTNNKISYYRNKLINNGTNR